MWRSRMFWRLFGTYGGLVLCAIAVLGLVVTERVERYQLQQLEATLRAKAVLVDEAFRDARGEGARLLQARVLALRHDVATRITLVADDGRVLADSEQAPEHMDNHADRPEVAQARLQRFGTARRLSATVGRPMFYLAFRTDRARSPVAFVRVALPLDEVEEQLAVLRRIIWGTAVLTASLAMALAFWLARRITRPIQELTTAAQRIAAGEFGQQVYALGHDEPAVLARAFNVMSEHLARQFAQLEEDRQQLRTVLSGMVEGVVALDAQQRILFANERASELLGVPLSASAGRHFWEVVRQRPLLEMLQRALVQPESQRRELNPSDGRSLTVYLARLQGSPDRGAVLVLHDTTELRKLERLRQDFVANVSHELKTPLAVIKAAVETLIDGAIDDPEHRGAFLDQVAEQAERLHALILDLLSLARIEAGTEAFERGPVPLGPAVADCLERHRGRAEARNLTLQSLPGAADPLAAWADEEAVGQIIDNLVDNAIKYTPPGGRVCVRWHADNGQVVLEVEDTGIGIPERDLPRVFERFYRVDKARSRELGGTGLGLSIVKHLAQAMDGSVDARSTVGQGSTFIVRLPLAS